MTITSYWAPETLEDLQQVLLNLQPQDKILAGGTDLNLRLHTGDVQQRGLLYLGCLPELKQLRQQEEGCTIGAAITMSRLAAQPLLQGPLQALAMAAAQVGSEQIRNRATIGGNVANASPAGDLLPVLIALQAKAVVLGPQGGFRHLPVQRLVTGPGQTSLAWNEVILGFWLPTPPGQVSAFLKLGYRQTVTIARINLGASLVMDSTGKIKQAHIVAGAIAPRPLCLTTAEQYLRGRRLSEVSRRHLGRLLAELMREVTPEKFDLNYKLQAAYGIAEDLWERLIAAQG